MTIKIYRMLRNRYVLCGVGIVITYLLFSILPANHFVESLLRGDQYRTYYLVYIPVLFVIFCLYTRRGRSFERIGRSLIFGTAAGYLSGLGAYIAVVFSLGDGLARIENTSEGLSGLIVILAVPFLYLSWAYGALAAFNIHLIEKKLCNRAEKTIVKQ